MFQFNDDKLPSIFSGFYTRNRDIHGHGTRTANDFGLIKCRTNTRQFTVKYTGAKIWNNIPINIRSMNTLNTFKVHYKKHLLLSV